MSDIRNDNLADVLVNYSIKAQPGEFIIIMGNILAEPLINATLKKALEAGAHPEVIMNSDEIDYTKIKYSNEEQLKKVSPFFKLAIDEADGIITIDAAKNTRSMNNIDPAKFQVRGLAKKEVNEKFMERVSKGDLKWVGTLFPCPAFAQEADMSLTEYEDFVYGATLADREDPVSEWEKIHELQEKLLDWLNGKDKVKINSPFVSLELSIKDRLFINGDGINNMPCGEVYTSPVEDSVNGWIKFSYPAIMSGREVEGIRLEFKDGKVIKASAQKNEEFLIKMLDLDEGSRYLGEFAIGTNYGITKFSKNILFDEKIGGTIHLAIGSGFPHAGGKNKSAIHWDMICDMQKDSEILVDGEVFYKDGKFLV